VLLDQVRHDVVTVLMQGRFGRFVLQGRAVVRHPEWIAKLVTVRVEGVPVPDAKAFEDHLSYCLVQLDNILCKLGSYFTDSNVMLGSMSKYYISYSHRNYKAFFTSTSVFEMIERDFFFKSQKIPNSLFTLFGWDNLGIPHKYSSY
jgi:hypothetical protein